MAEFMHMHNKPLAQRKITLILLAAALLLIIIGISAYFNREKSSFEIQDKCGRMMNLFSHTINDPEECKVRCMSQCKSEDFKYKNSDFETSDNNGCNKCRCSCK